MPKGVQERKALLDFLRRNGKEGKAQELSRELEETSPEICKEILIAALSDMSHGGLNRVKLWLAEKD